MSDSFNADQYLGRDRIFIKVPSYQGVSSIWDWDKTKKKYRKRNTGVKYYAYKKMGGVQRSKFFESFEAALKWRDSEALYIDNVPEKEMTFCEVRGRYSQKARSRLRISTYETYESHLKHLRFFDPLPMSQINAKAIDAWLIAVKSPEYRKGQHSNRLTYLHELSVLKQILLYYSEYEDDSYQVPIKKRHADDSIIDHFRYKLAKAEKRNSFIPRADFERFLEGLHQLSQTKPEVKVYSVLAEFQLGGGPRIGEACAVNFEDVDFQTGAVIISKTVLWSRKKGRPTYVSPLTKTDSSRIIYLTERGLASLREWRILCGRSKGLVFSFDGFAPLPYRNVQYHYDSIFRRLHLKWRSTHILRHSYATDFLEKTGRKDALQGQLGHSSSKQTDHYAKITRNSIEAGVKAYDLSLRDSNVVELFEEKKPRSEFRN